jgi:hypothetical protein
MKSILILLFTTVSFVIYGQRTDQEVISNTLSDKHVSVAGTKVSLIAPDGFDKSVNFNGFQQSEKSSSVMIIEMPGPFSEITKAFTKSGLKSQGVDLIAKKDLTINGFPAVFIEAEQTAYGTLFIKYILTFGTESNTTMINGMFPKEFNKEMSSDIKNSLLSVVYETDKNVNPLDEIDYTVDIENTKLKYANVLANAIIYTVDGKVPTESDDKTFYTIASSLGKIEITDKKQYAINRLNKTATIKNISPNNIQEIEINGFKGYEIIAKGINEKTGKEEQIYYVMLFNDNLYYLLMGVAENDFENNIDLFKKVTKTFSLK